jgi:hypothetical protein
VARRRFKPDGSDVDLTAEPAKVDDGVFVGPPAPHAAPEFDLGMPAPPAPAPAPPVAMPMPDAETLLLPLEERLRRVEAALTRLAELQQPDARGDGARGEVTARPGGPSVLSRAAALLPALSLSTRPAGPAATAGASGRLGLLRDSLAELQAIYYMYVDPRYRLSWFGRFTPLALLLVFLTSSWWLTLVACGVGAFFDPLVKLAISFALFKVLGLEARRYRETAPDLPAHLRL